LDAAAIGLEFTGIWDEATGTLLPYYILPGAITADGEDLAMYSGVTITLATSAYFSAATDEEMDAESCEMFAIFAGTDGDEETMPFPIDMTAREFDWSGGVGGVGTGPSVDLWDGAAWEGGLSILTDDWVEADCEGWKDTFDGMHYGVGFGDLSTYFTAELSSYEWWDDAVHSHSYFTNYTAMNHPEPGSSLGYDFIGYDYTRGAFFQADPTICFEGTEVCGAVKLEPGDEPGSYFYIDGNFDEDIGSRYGFIKSTAWWFEDFPVLDLDMMGEGF
jgi:hypothetical protein